MADTNEPESPEVATVEDRRGPRASRRLRRGPGGRLGGVAHGLAQYFDMDAGLVEIILVILAVMSGGSIVLVYLAAWLLIPPADDPDPRPFRVIQDPARLITGVLVLLVSVGAVLGKIVFSVTGLDLAPGSDLGPLVVPTLLVGIGVALLGRPPRHPVSEPRPEPDRAVPEPGAAVHGWAVPRAAAETVATPPPGTRDPVGRDSGPPVAAMTVAVVGAVIGVMALVDQLFEIHIGITAYIATATSLIGLGLVVASFVGRTLPLILLGVPALMALSLSPILESGISGGFGPRVIEVSEMSALGDTYEVGAGSIELDLSRLVLSQDTEITLRVGAGYADVLVPPGTPVTVTGTVTAGELSFFDQESNGIRTRLEADRSGEGPVLTLILEIVFGRGTVQ